MELLTGKQTDQLRLIFTVFAADLPSSSSSSSSSSQDEQDQQLAHSGIGAKELTGVLHALGVIATESEVNEYITRADSSGRGYLDFAEFALLMSSGELADVDIEAELVEAFQRCDGDGDGLIGPQDVASTIQAGAPVGTGTEFGVVPGGVGAGSIGGHVPLTVTDLEGVVFEVSGPRAKGIDLDQFVGAMRAQG